MRGDDFQQDGMFSYVSPDKRIPQDHPLRPIRKMVDQALREMSPLFDSMYEDTGRRSVPPEKMLRALLLQILYTVRSERLLIEQLEYNLLFRWFVGLDLNQKVWGINLLQRDIATFLNNPQAVQLIQKIIGEVFCGALLHMPEFSLNFALLHTWLARHGSTSISSN